MTKKIGKLLAGAAISLSLGYGATQAFASPAASGEFCQTFEEKRECGVICAQVGMFGNCSEDRGCICEP